MSRHHFPAPSLWQIGSSFMKRYRAARQCALTHRALANLGVDVRKDIGWPSDDDSRYSRR
jgi:hypothetical protein